MMCYVQVWLVIDASWPTSVLLLCIQTFPEHSSHQWLLFSTLCCHDVTVHIAHDWSSSKTLHCMASCTLMLCIPKLDLCCSCSHTHKKHTWHCVKVLTHHSTLTRSNRARSYWVSEHHQRVYTSVVVLSKRSDMIVKERVTTTIGKDRVPQNSLPVV